MNQEIKTKIEQIKNGIIPAGYRKTKIGVFPDDWKVYRIDHCLERVKHPVDVQPGKLYTQIGIRSHGKGLFYKEPVTGESLGKKSVFWIEPDCFILNIVFAWERAIGKTTENEVGMIGSHRFPMYRPVNGIVDIDYLCLYMLTNRGKYLLETASPGGAGRNKTLGQDRFMKSKIILPPLEEQKRIVEIISLQDDIIALCNQKIEQLQLMKKYYLQEMFPKRGCDYPEIRFPGFTNPWEQRKWSDTVDISTDMVDPKSGLYDDLPHVAPGNIESFTGRLFDNVKLVKDENLISGKFRFSAGDIIYGKINPQLGKYVFAAFSGLTSADAYVLNSKNGVDQKFLYAVLQTQDFFNYSVSVSKRSGMPKINRDELNAYSFAAPSTTEQAKIGEFLLSIDNLITLHQCKYA